MVLITLAFYTAHVTNILAINKLENSITSPYSLNGKRVKTSSIYNYTLY